MSMVQHVYGKPDGWLVIGARADEHIHYLYNAKELVFSTLKIENPDASVTAIFVFAPGTYCYVTLLECSAFTPPQE